MHFKKRAGDTVTLDFSTEFEAGRDLTGIKVIASFARRRGETAVLVKKNLAAGGDSSQILSAIAGQVVSGSVFYTPTNTRPLTGEYEWDIVGQTADGAETTMASGTISFGPRVTYNFT